MATVHPRIRGERGFLLFRFDEWSGSSPHTRGTHQFSIARQVRCRFIPAYAGNAGRVTHPTVSPAVHPRIRGERMLFTLARKSNHGSSPHTRGTPINPIGFSPTNRFIPAYAGNATDSYTYR